MKLQSIRATALAIPFQESFKHASAERATTQAIWVAAGAAGGMTGHGEGCPREYVTGESVASAKAFVAAHIREWIAELRDTASLCAWTAKHDHEIDTHPAAWTAVELALLDLLGKASRQPVESLLALPRLAGRFHYTAVLGDAPPAAFQAQLGRYLAAGFRAFKIKLSGERARDAEKVRALRAAGVAPQRVRADANNLWPEPDAAIEHLRALDYRFAALEEPLRPGDYQGMACLAQALGTDIILDESMQRRDQLAWLPENGRWIVNLRISKMGGLLRSLEFLREARRLGLRVIIGAHVGETSVLTRAALAVASVAGEALVAQEGAFGTYLLQRDVSEPSLMFGAGGVLEAAPGLAAAPGWGLAIREPD
jgi:L-alanine-DL-glutamate epimerase-like enolase superfamily enzyme